MEPLTTATTAWTIAKTAGEISKKLYEFGRSLKDRDAKQHVDEIVDNLRDLKQRASELEDENRGLRERLRFNSDEYQFRNPFWYHKTQQVDQPLCPKCFANKIPAPMSQQGLSCDAEFRRCLVCQACVQVTHRSQSDFHPGRGGEWS